MRSHIHSPPHIAHHAPSIVRCSHSEEALGHLPFRSSQGWRGFAASLAIPKTVLALLSLSQLAMVGPTLLEVEVKKND